MTDRERELMILYGTDNLHKLKEDIAYRIYIDRLRAGEDDAEDALKNWELMERRLGL